MQFYNELGSGSYGQVFLCKYKDAIYAVKKILLETSTLDVLVRELIVLNFLQTRSEHVPKLFYVGLMGHMTETPDKLYLLLFMERCKKVKRKEPQDAGPVLATLAEALESIHVHDIMHRDISSGNIMLRPNGKIAFVDFGLACYGPSTNCRNTFTSRVTTIFARAPELICANKKKEYGKEIDLFSLGVTAMYFSGLSVYKNEPKTDTYFKNVYAELQRSLKLIDAERYRFSRLLDLHSRPSLRSIRHGLQTCTFEPREDETTDKNIDVPDVSMKIVMPDVMIDLANLPEQSRLFKCNMHTDFTKSLEISFQDVISGHTSCIQHRASKICESLCDGNCLMSACVSFAISWAFHEHVHTEYVKNLLKFCKYSVSDFLHTFGKFLCYSVCLENVFVPCSRHENT